MSERCGQSAMTTCRRKADERRLSLLSMTAYKVPSGSSDPKAGLQPVSPRPHLPIMVPLSSHSFKQWGQLGEILGGVRFPECGAHRSLADRPAWGSGVEYRQNKTFNCLDIRSNGGHPSCSWKAEASTTKAGDPYFCGINSYS